MKENTRRPHWYDDECRDVIKDRKRARLKWIQNRNNKELEDDYIEKRRISERTRTRKKRATMNRILENIDTDRREGRIRSHYKGIKLIKNGYQAIGIE